MASTMNNDTLLHEDSGCGGHRILSARQRRRHLLLLRTVGRYWRWLRKTDKSRKIRKAIRARKSIGAVVHQNSVVTLHENGDAMRKKKTTRHRHAVDKEREERSGIVGCVQPQQQKRLNPWEESKRNQKPSYPKKVGRYSYTKIATLCCYFSFNPTERWVSFSRAPTCKLPLR